jgi:type IV fimbrial biogenesis protein FimT
VSTPATQSGITLIEMMVVILIVSILVVVGLPSLTGMVRNQRIKTASLDLYSSLVLARSEGIKRNASNVSIIAEAGGWQNGWKVCVDTDSDSTCDASEVLLLQQEPIDTSITVSGPTGNIITYNRDGRLATASASFTLRADANDRAAPMRCVDVDVSGRPRTRMDTNAIDSDGCN